MALSLEVKLVKLKHLLLSTTIGYYRTIGF